MFRRQIRNLIATLILLIFIAFGLYLLDYLSRPKALTLKDIGIDEKVLKNATEFTIQHGRNRPLQFKLVRGAWHVNEKPADSEKIRSFLDSLSSMIIESELGEFKGREKEFSLDELSRYRLVFKKGNRKMEIFFGKVGPTLHTRYMVLKGSNRVYLVSGSFADDIGLELKDWRDRKLIKMNGLKKMNVETTGSSWTLEVKGQTAVLVLGDRKAVLDSSQFESLKINLEGIRAEDFIDNPSGEERQVLKNPLIKVRLVYGGDTVEIVFARKDSDYYYASSSAYPWVFLVPFYHVEGLLPDSLKNYLKEQPQD